MTPSSAGDPDPRPLAPEEVSLLRILCCVAWCDGDVSPQEKELLGRLVLRYFSPEGSSASLEDLRGWEALLAEVLPVDALDELIPRLASPEDRLLALKLAYMVIRVDRRPGDDSSINPQEKVAYRRLVQGLGLDDAEIREIEWAAEQELASPTTLLGIFRKRFGGLLGEPSGERP